MFMSVVLVMQVHKGNLSFYTSLCILLVFTRGCGDLQIQCNVFDGFSGEVALTAGGGRRELPLLKNAFEDVALVSLTFLDSCP